MTVTGHEALPLVGEVWDAVGGERIDAAFEKAKRLHELLAQFLTDYPARMFLLAGTSHHALAKVLPLPADEILALIGGRYLTRAECEAIGLKPMENAQ